MSDNECAHENIEWVSGHEFVTITLNEYDVECLDCGMTATYMRD